MTLALAITGTVLGALSFSWNVWTWRRSGSRIRVETSFSIFPGLAINQLTNILAQTQSQQPTELATMAQKMIQQYAQIPIPTNLSYPASPDLIAVMHSEMVLLVATITNTGRLPVTIQRCQWQTSQPGFIEAPNTQPGVSFPHRLQENDRCISVITLATIQAVLDAPLRDKSVTGREAWPIVEVANLRKPVRGKSVAIPMRSQPLGGGPQPPQTTGSEQAEHQRHEADQTIRPGQP
jgi:hypothetical protein